MHLAFIIPVLIGNKKDRKCTLLDSKKLSNLIPLQPQSVVSLVTKALNWHQTTH